MQTNIITFLAALFGEQLASQVEFLQCENKILRQRIARRRVIPTPEERFELLKLGKPLGANLKDIISIVNYDTFKRWICQEKDPNYGKVPKKKRGPNRKAPELRKLVAQMARKNKWGITRILGELHKLNIFQFSLTTVANILKENGIPPADKRREPWINGLKRHYDTLIACDFFKQWIWTLQGPKLAFVLFYINIRTRKVKLAGISAHPTASWTIEHTKKVFEDTEFAEGGKQILIRDLDRKFTKEFDGYLKSKGFDIYKTPPRSPNLNAFAETWIAKMRHECTNHFLVLGMRHLQHLVEEYVGYYNTKRPHYGKDLQTLEPVISKSDGEIKTIPILGGLHHHYYKE